jgi:hypothetical protein
MYRICIGIYLRLSTLTYVFMSYCYIQDKVLLVISVSFVFKIYLILFDAFRKTE